MTFRTILPKLEESNNGNFDQYYGLTRNYFLYLAATSNDVVGFQQALHAEGTRKYKRKGERLYQNPSIATIDEATKTFRIDYEEVLLPPSARIERENLGFGIWMQQYVGKKWTGRYRTSDWYGRSRQPIDFHIDEIMDSHFKTYQEKAWRTCGDKETFEKLVQNGLIKFI